MAITDPEFWIKHAFPITIGVIIYLGLTAQSTVCALILYGIVLLLKVKEIPRWLKVASTIVKNVHAVQFAIAVISSLLVVVYMVFNYGVNTLVFSMEYIGLIVIPSAIAMIMWEALAKRPMKSRPPSTK